MTQADDPTITSRNAKATRKAIAKAESIAKSAKARVNLVGELTRTNRTGRAPQARRRSVTKDLAKASRDANCPPAVCAPKRESVPSGPSSLPRATACSSNGTDLRAE